jgi:hypothetical protein
MALRFEPLSEGSAQYFEGVIDRAAAAAREPSFSIDGAGRIVATTGDGAALVISLPPSQLLLLALRATQAAEAQGASPQDMLAGLGPHLTAKGNA